MPAAAQALVFRQHLAIDQPGAVSIDRLNHVYVTDAKNNLLKFAKDGRLLYTFSPPQSGRASLVEAWNMLKVFLFYDAQGEVVLLDRFLNPLSSFNLNEYIEGMIRLATLAADNRFWVLDESNLSLLKIDVQRGDAVIQAPLNQILSRDRYDLRFLREYQNTVYLVDHNSGIYLFDNMGNYEKKLPFAGLSYIGFRGNELYYLAGQKIHFFDLYTFQELAVPVPEGKIYQRVLVGENYVYLFSGEGMDIYSLP